MTNYGIANRYAKALFELAKQEGKLGEVAEQLYVIRDVLIQNPEFLSLLQHPKVEVPKKKEMLAEAFAATDAIVKNTLSLLVDNNRQTIIPDLAPAFDRLKNAHTKEEQAIVYTIRPLTEEEKQAVAESFQKKLNVQSLRIQNVIDDKILGGMKVRIGNTVYDGTLSGKVERIARELKANRS